MVFDFYGTLVDEEDGELRRDREIFRRFGYELSEPLRRHWIDPVTCLDHVPFSSDRDSYAGWQSELWRQGLREHGIADQDLETLVEHAVTRSRTRRFSAFPDAVETLQALRSAGTRTAVCSNWGWDLGDAVGSCGLAELVEVVVGSATSGYRKPHNRIFEIVLERLGLGPAEVLFVGDTWSADVEGALSAGLWAAEVVRQGENGEERRLPDRVIRVSRLTELLPLLRSPARPEDGSRTR